MKTLQSIKDTIHPSICYTEHVYDDFKQRLDNGLLTRDENDQSHFCVYFLPFNPKNNKVFIVHHKKSGLWLSPGGHIDRGETVFEALNREINEELGLKDFFKKNSIPFLLTVTPIENQIQPCKRHYDIWYTVFTDGSDFNISPEEFHETAWLTVEDARKKITNPQNVLALEILEKNLI